MSDEAAWIGNWSCTNCNKLIIARASSADAVLSYSTEKRNGLTIETLRAQCPCCNKIVKLHRPEVTVTFTLHARIWEWMAETYASPEDEVRDMVERQYADEMAIEASEQKAT